LYFLEIHEIKTGESMKRVYIDENGNVNDISPQGMSIWLEKHDQMIANGATEVTAKDAADIAQKLVDDICFNGIIDEDE
jgi:hypothetical protein